ncbi:MAG: DUF4136 domain-containing protein [Cyclobacteriaceae bacterium]
MRSIHITFLSFIFTSCAVQVKTYQNPGADLSAYESWCWMQGCEIVYQGPEYYNDERVINEVSNAIAWNMHDKGYLQGDDQSDLVLNFYMILKEDSAEISEIYTEDYNDNREWLPTFYPEYQRFLKGSLVIDIIDRKSSDLVWTSTAVKYMEMNPVYDKKSIWNGVNKAMKKFPVREE